MDTQKIDAILAAMKPEEVRDALWMIDVFERWNMPAEEADEWRRRIQARAEFQRMRDDAATVD